MPALKLAAGRIDHISQYYSTTCPRRCVVCRLTELLLSCCMSTQTCSQASFPCRYVPGKASFLIWRVSDQTRCPRQRQTPRCRNGSRPRQRADGREPVQRWRRRGRTLLQASRSLQGAVERVRRRRERGQHICALLVITCIVKWPWLTFSFHL